MNLLLGEIFSKEYLSRLAIKVDRRGLKRLYGLVRQGFHVYIKHLDISTNSIIDWAFAEGKGNLLGPPWNREFIEIYTQSL